MKNIIKISLLICIASMVLSACGQNPRTTDEGIVINGVRWATRNVDKPGTFTAKPEDAGMFYQWNRKVGWSVTDPLVNSDGGTTWNDSKPAGESWRKENDPCPCGWRVPTETELASLNEVSSEWSELNGKPGRFFGSGKQSIFLPAAGYRHCNSSALISVGTYGNYWSNRVNGTTAFYLDFYSETVYPGFSMFRGYGRSLRCVSE